MLAKKVLPLVSGNSSTAFSPSAIFQIDLNAITLL